MVPWLIVIGEETKSVRLLGPVARTLCIRRTLRELSVVSSPARSLESSDVVALRVLVVLPTVSVVLFRLLVVEFVTESMLLSAPERSLATARVPLVVLLTRLVRALRSFSRLSLQMFRMAATLSPVSATMLESPLPVLVVARPLSVMLFVAPPSREESACTRLVVVSVRVRFLSVPLWVSMVVV